jgi:hypothetical protein
MHLIHIILIIAILCLIYVGNNMMLKRIENIEDFVVEEAREQRNYLKMLDLIKGIEKANDDNVYLEQNILEVQKYLNSYNEDN